MKSQQHLPLSIPEQSLLRTRHYLPTLGLVSGQHDLCSSTGSGQRGLRAWTHPFSSNDSSGPLRAQCEGFSLQVRTQEPEEGRGPCQRQEGPADGEEADSALTPKMEGGVGGRSYPMLPPPAFSPQAPAGKPPSLLTTTCPSQLGGTVPSRLTQSPPILITLHPAGFARSLFMPRCQSTYT